MDYIAIDFETANSNNTSACSLGIVIVQGNKIEEKYYLINPETHFDPYNISIHHITEEDVKDSPTFPKVWEEIKDYFTGIVVAHNAGFDLSVLKALIEKYNLEAPRVKICCTVKISQKLWKDILPNCKLNTISEYLEVEHNHHNALSDAYVCVKIVERAIRMTNSATLEEAMESLGLLFGYYSNERFYLPRNRYKEVNKDAPDNFFKGKIVAYGGKPKTVTKKQVAEILQIKGANVSRSIDRSIDTFIMFDACPKEKQMQLEEMKKRCQIDILSEDDFLRVIK